MQQLSWVPVLLAVAIHVVLIAVAIWDLIAAASDHHSLSVSHLFQAWALEYPMLPFAVGVIIGHLLWPVR